MERLRSPANQFLFDPAVAEEGCALLLEAAAALESVKAPAVGELVEELERRAERFERVMAHETADLMRRAAKQLRAALGGKG